tara:strand:+ start:1038 stop:1178 length:141 start_codon:yes stop_codon:yes gene_type:complete
MDNESLNKKNNKFFNIKKIPLVAFIFPPIGFLLLIKYLIKKNKKGL